MSGIRRAAPRPHRLAQPLTRAGGTIARTACGTRSAPERAGASAAAWRRASAAAVRRCATTVECANASASAYWAAYACAQLVAAPAHLVGVVGRDVGQRLPGLVGELAQPVGYADVVPVAVTRRRLGR